MANKNDVVFDPDGDMPPDLEEIIEKCREIGVVTIKVGVWEPLPAGIPCVEQSQRHDH